VAQVIVPDYQLSLAIGKEGQNARLAARLTGWRIDIRPDSPGDTPVASAGPEEAGQAGSGEGGPGPASRQGEGGPGEGEGGPGGDNAAQDAELASAVKGASEGGAGSGAPGPAGTVPGAPDAQAL
jgi:hypothetical protein